MGCRSPVTGVFPACVCVSQHQADHQAALAARALVQTMLERWFDRARKVFSSPSQVPGWHEASGWSQKHAFMTPAEAAAAREEINNVLDRYDARQVDPALRPPGAHPVEWTTFTMPIAERAPHDASPSPGLIAEPQP